MFSVQFMNLPRTGTYVVEAGCGTTSLKVVDAGMPVIANAPSVFVWAEAKGVPDSFKALTVAPTTAAASVTTGQLGALFTQPEKEMAG
ncbi:MAG: hypothetical protein Q7U75_08435, partial [Desulfobacterales bacterium]|nr:hypothetical protein [Desulfobacterales bacterium]